VIIPYRLVVAPRADTDIDRILHRIAQGSSATAIVWAEALEKQFALICETPHRNIVVSQAPSSKDPVRSAPFLPYMIFFRTVDAERVVRILRVRHGARRPIGRFE
jgi:plasmid stabilization system protein ParE